MPNWKSLENVTALVLGLAGLAFGDPGVTASGIVGGVGLVAGWRAAKAKSGMKSKKLVDKVRAEVRSHYQEWTSGRCVEEADLNAADLLMEQDLLNCMPDPQALAAVVTNPGDYPRAAARLVVDRLAERHPLFAAEGGRESSATARAFALLTVEAALRAALADKDYVLTLLPHMVAALGQELAQLTVKASAILDSITKTNDEMRNLFDEVPDIALRREIMLLVGSHPQSSAAEIAGDVARFARQYRALLLEIATAKADDNLLRGAEQSAEQALLDGDLSLARRLLDDAVQAATDRVRTPAADLARLLDRQARAAMLQRDWVVADRAWASASKTLRLFAPSAACELEQGAARALSDHGEIHGVSGALEAAIPRWINLATAFESQDQGSAAGMWAELSRTLQILGARTAGEEGLALLFSAVRSGAKAVRMFGEARMPAEWATALGQSGNALHSIGSRVGGDDGLAFLEEAAQAYGAALPVYEKCRMLSHWAATQSNIGALLRTRGERTSGAEGLDLLDRALAAYEAALAVHTEAEMPIEWSGIMNNLGGILARQSERAEGDEKRRLSERAVAYFRAALTARTLEASPVLWAESQNNLGGILVSLGQSCEGEEKLALLSEAVDALKSALVVRTVDSMPVHWATTKNNLANALILTAESTEGDDGLRLLAEAVEAIEDALKIRTREAMAIQWATTQNNLGNALQAHGERVPGEVGLARLRKAAAAFRSALSVLTSEHFSQIRIGVEANLNACLSVIEERETVD